MADAFDEIVAGIRRSYHPSGDGSYFHPGPCVTCGSHSFELLDTPVCLVCSKRVEDMRVDIELLSRHMDSLNEVARLLPSEAQRELRHQAEFWMIHLSKLLLAVGE